MQDFTKIKLGGRQNREGGDFLGSKRAGYRGMGNTF